MTVQLIGYFNKIALIKLTVIYKMLKWINVRDLKKMKRKRNGYWARCFAPRCHRNKFIALLCSFAFFVRLVIRILNKN